MIEQRISLLIQTLGIKQKEFADKINLKPNTLSMIKSGKRSLTDRTISDICREFKVSASWLQTGKGDIFILDSNEELDILCKKYNLDDLDRKLVENYLKLSPEQRTSCKSWMKSMFGIFNEN